MAIHRRRRKRSAEAIERSAAEEFFRRTDLELRKIRETLGGTHAGARQAVITLAQFASAMAMSSALQKVVASIAARRQVRPPRRGAAVYTWLLHVFQMDLPGVTANRYANAIAMCRQEGWSDRLIERNIGTLGLAGRRPRRRKVEGRCAREVPVRSSRTIPTRSTAERSTARKVPARPRRLAPARSRPRPPARGSETSPRLRSQTDMNAPQAGRGLWHRRANSGTKTSTPVLSHAHRWLGDQRHGAGGVVQGPLQALPHQRPDIGKRP